MIFILQTNIGWTIATNCNDYGIYDWPTKADSKAAVNGRYQFQHYAVCDAGEPGI